MSVVNRNARDISSVTNERRRELKAIRLAASGRKAGIHALAEECTKIIETKSALPLSKSQALSLYGLLHPPAKD